MCGKKGDEWLSIMAVPNERSVSVDYLGSTLPVLSGIDDLVFKAAREKERTLPNINYSKLCN